MLLAGEAGRGVVQVNGEEVAVAPGTLVVMPWGHRVSYRPDPRDPYLVYGAHLIPWHADPGPVDLAVPHHRDHPLGGSELRADLPLGIGPGLWLSDEREHPALKTLIKVSAQLWDRGTPSLDTARALGLLLIEALGAATPTVTHADHRLPVRLRRTLAWVNAEPGRAVSLGQLAEVAGVSTATTNRMFQQYLGTSPLAWVLGTRITVAKSLLTTTGLPVNQVARRSGFSDAYYFSRQFRAHTGLSPSIWRRRHSSP